MTKSERVTAADELRLVRLVNECRELGAAAAAWQGHLLAGLNRLAGARVGTAGPVPADPSAVAHFAAQQLAGDWPSAAARRQIETWMREPPVADHPAIARFLLTPGDTVGRTRRELVTDADWEAAPLVNDLIRGNGFDDGLIARTVAPAAGCGYLLTLVRTTGDRPFRVRHGRLVEAAVRELTPHLGRSLWLTTQPNLSGLSARLREVLTCLLDGDGEKQAAARLGLRPVTVHDHAKRLYRHFGVHTRPELLAVFLRRVSGAGEPSPHGDGSPVTSSPPAAHPGCAP